MNINQMNYSTRLPEASFPLAFLVMTTLEDTVVGVLAAMTTPTNNKELMFMCNLKNKMTRPKTKNGIKTKLII